MLVCDDMSSMTFCFSCEKLYGIFWNATTGLIIDRTTQQQCQLVQKNYNAYVIFQLNFLMQPSIQVLENYLGSIFPSIYTNAFQYRFSGALNR